MLLAGGAGSRLRTLTDNTAKPAITFGGKYKIIDFTLSNCYNSNIDTVGVLTQYNPLYLNEYIGNGDAWGLNRTDGGIQLLPPYVSKSGANWYSGTANAVWQNLHFIERYSPEYVLILSGDHIYKMDYSKLIEHHKLTKADCTIAVTEVPLRSAVQFGIVLANDKGEIYDFQEKPQNPRSCCASMGVYVFNYKFLKSYLEYDHRNEQSDNDFGKNIIPSMIYGGERIWAYRFTDYWKDVGSTVSLWESNMDLLGDNPRFDIKDEKWCIYNRMKNRSPMYISSSAEIKNSIVSDGCAVRGKVFGSVLSFDVMVEKGAVVVDSVLMEGVRVCAGTVINKCIIDQNTIIAPGCTLGEVSGEIAVVKGNMYIKNNYYENIYSEKRETVKSM